MRDLLICAIVFGSLPFILWRPQIGVMVWVWLSVMNPHRLAHGFSYDFGFVALVAVVTLVGSVFSRDLARPRFTLPILALLLFGTWTAVTTSQALHPQPALVMWTTLMKTLLLAFLIPVLFHRAQDLRRLLWVLVLSLAFYGVKGGLWILLTGGVDRVWGPPDSYVADNNSIAVALVMTIPLMYYLQITTPHRSVRYGLAAAMLLCGVAVLGTYSRGALLAVSAMMAFLWWKGRHKFPVLALAAVVLPLVLSLMPEKWYERMATIAEYHQERSAAQRLNAWATMWNLAGDRPVVGGGFVVDTAEVYARYSPDQSFKPHVAHSIYFQALGEHGFVGLGLYIFVLAAFWIAAAQAARIAASRSELSWVRDQSLAMQVSLIGFAVGGAFLSLVNFDVPYYLIGVVAATLQLVKRQSASASPRVPTYGGAPA